AIVQFILPDDSEITLLLNHLDEPRELAQVTTQAIRDASLAHTPSVFIEDQSPPGKIAGQESNRFIMLVGSRQTNQWVLSQALTMYDHYTLLALQLATSTTTYHQALDLFADICAHIQIMSAQERDQRRAQMFQNADAWLEQHDT